MKKNILLLLFFLAFLTSIKTSAQHLCIEMPPVKSQDEIVKPRSVGVKAKFWRAGQTITIKFIGGEPFVRQKVQQYAMEWTKFANLKFQFVGDNSQAMIRIAFQKGGSYSYVGTDNLLIPENQHTMNYGWLTPQSPEQEFSRVVVHEFGHMLGLMHEHQHPESSIPWNKPKVYEYYASIGWSKQQVDDHVFKRYDHGTTQYSEYDRLSIMHYAVPASLTTNGFEVAWNTELSSIDKDFIGKVYPFNNNNNNNVSTIPPSCLLTGWYDLPFHRLDASIYYNNEVTYLFSGRRYTDWSYESTAPRSIMKDWGIPFDRIDDAFYWKGNSKVYFFRGDEYVRYDTKSEKMDNGFPKKIKDQWRGLEIFTKIDASLPWKDKVYFFSGNQYLRFDFKSNRIDPGYPKNINAQTWGGVGFDRIDAVMLSDYPYVYLFRGAQYYKFDMEKNTVVEE